MSTGEGTAALPRALTIAGSDSGGGAGIQADLKTFQELGVYGMSALTAITAQNTTGVQAVYPLQPEEVVQQIRSIGSDIGTDALKTGMLFSSEIIRAVAGEIREQGWTKLVVDPVMIAKGGAALLLEDAVQAMREELFPLAEIVTPNIPEAEVLTGVEIRNEASKREAAKRLAFYGARHVIIKGGHDHGTEAIDLLYDGQGFTELAGRRIETGRTHGTGCTFSAALVSGLAQGLAIDAALKQAKAFIQAAIEDGIRIGSGHGPTNHWAYRRRMALQF
ncbi:bifunctional hydroxymethylpyrimidine kinase/phosphomethylpyrimidine kinase [Paenibacillus sp. GCM10012307]|uniref:Hydroxymethylpyrimidine/phosphomethylpyrimidine kinase n=1 Tax=Paenibacillus roseus TaxID=2798579 RepID=A0A934J094_9BACL|nr:bifunctional hydroxymethylpyrimidine kinase/phosphomethylpyrimidine kinase [Paenibacillus roseus]MBJ6360345.1 bifunctional hydroxymethylpyrimidine kinase/phosphomethylpyrimidine kinase [Paenibacillus roseus]